MNPSTNIASELPRKTTLNLPTDYPRIRRVQSFQELLGIPLSNGVNALVWERSLPGDFCEVVERLGAVAGVATLDESRLLSLQVSQEVRVIHNWNLMLVEQGLEIYLRHADSPPHGYKLAADYCQNYDSRYGNGLNGPSRTKIEEIVRFLFTYEALEGEAP